MAETCFTRLLIGLDLKWSSLIGLEVESDESWPVLAGTRNTVNWSQSNSVSRL